MHLRPRRRAGGRAARRGVAAVELAILLPPLCFLGLIATDFARALRCTQIITACSRNGAFYGSYPDAATKLKYASIEEAALADADYLSPSPTVASATGTDASGSSYVDVTVSYPFQTIVDYPGIPHTLTLARTTRMAITPPF